MVNTRKSRQVVYLYEGKLESGTKGVEPCLIRSHESFQFQRIHQVQGFSHSPFVPLS